MDENKWYTIDKNIQKITEACKTIEADGKVKYEALVKDNHLCFDTDGNFVKSEKRKS